MSKPLADFQRYQLEFAAWLRKGSHNAAPDLPHDRLAIYRNLILHNLSSSLSACFPIATQTAGKLLWGQLLLAFLEHYSANQPLFRKIPAQFLEFLQSPALPAAINLPPYLTQLCHYEWIELHVSSLDCTVWTKPDGLDAKALITHKPLLNPTLQILRYDYPVHQISAHNKPAEPNPTWLLVYRNQDDTVKFIETNALTYELMTLIKEQQLTGMQALEIVAKQLPPSSLANILAFGEHLLADLLIQGIITDVDTSLNPAM